ncbi:hypothetical protein [Cupriavidus sp. H39]|uniref:hypothetical protein n=1 Tax=Cupriavidus sp. H39 TaxID=3401635 RepID=UPI003D05B2F1
MIAQQLVSQLRFSISPLVPLQLEAWQRRGQILDRLAQNSTPQAIASEYGDGGTHFCAFLAEGAHREVEDPNQAARCVTVWLIVLHTRVGELVDKRGWQQGNHDLRGVQCLRQRILMTQRAGAGPEAAPGRAVVGLEVGRFKVNREWRVDEGDIEPARVDILHSCMPKAAIEAGGLDRLLDSCNRGLVHINAEQAVPCRVCELQQSSGTD